MPKYKIELSIELESTYISLVRFFMARPDMYTQMKTTDPKYPGYVIAGSNHLIEKDK